MNGGVVNDNVVFPVLDLIRKELKTSGASFDGIPSVTLYRDHPLDEYVVTGATMIYESGMIEEVGLTRGSDDESTYPEGVDESHHDYTYCKLWRLTTVYLSYLNKGGDPIAQYIINLAYDKKGLLESTSVQKF